MKVFSLLSLGLLLASPSRADVVINEMVAASSDRQLVRVTGQYPTVGNTRSWQQPAFDDSFWKSGNGPFGFGSLGVTLGTNVSADVQNRTPSLYLRKIFTATAADASSTATLNLKIRYNDGFIAYINGKEVARHNMGNPGMLAYRDQPAYNPSTSANIVTIPLGQAVSLLTSGVNTLAIQVHNQSLGWPNGDSLLLAADLQIGTTTTLLTGTGAWKYFGGNAEPSGGLIDYGQLTASLAPSVPWAKRTFNDSSWQAGTGPVGMETAVPAQYILGVNLAAQMSNITPSVYIRHHFTATATEATSNFPLSLSADYDDGAIVYLNGIEIFRSNLGTPGVPFPHDNVATADRPANGDLGVPRNPEISTLAPAKNLLVTGENVLSIQLHNASLTSSDAIATMILSSTGSAARTLVSPTDPLRYFVGVTEPTVPTQSQAEDSAEPDSGPADSESDWIELKNTTAAAISLAGWSLSDDASNPRLWSFPPTASIPANGHLLVLASGLNLLPNIDATTYLHTNFKLSSSGDIVILTRPDNTIADQFTANYPPQSWRYSYGRQADGTFGYLETATPGQVNSSTALIPAPTNPTFSTLGGFHPSSLSITLTCPTPGATIRYSIDGSDPLTGTLYSGPLSIPSNTILRARSFLPGAIPSAPITHTYLIGQSAARRSLAAVVLGGDPARTFYGPNATGGPANGEGIFAIKGGTYSGGVWQSGGNTAAFHNPTALGRSSEKNATLEFLPLIGTPFRTEMGLRISGSPYSRPRYTLTDAPSSPFAVYNPENKPSFNIFFRSEFSEKLIDYPFFPQTPITKFENIRLRAGKNDISSPFIIDELMRRTFIATGNQGSVGTFTTVWLNGTFKGYYNMTERLREPFMQQHHGSSQLWDVNQINDFADGDPIAWNEMLAYMRSANLATTAGYAGVHNLFDVDNFIDYLIVNTFAGTWDWPNNNWVAARERSSLGRWRFYMWDAEGAFGQQSGRNPSYNSFTSDLTIPLSDAQTTGWQYIPALYTLLKASPEFRLRYADRTQKQLFQGGPLVNSRMTTLFNQLKNEINPIMQETIGQGVDETFHNDWIVPTTRRTNLFSQMTSQGLWPSITAPTASQYGGQITSGYQLSLTNPNPSGQIYYTTNGADPRSPGGAATGSTYSAPLTLAAATRIRARVLSGTTWSPEIALDFALPFSQPTFIHSTATSRDWTTNPSWTSNPTAYPNAAGLAATIPAAPSNLARNVELGASVTIGALTFDQGNSILRSRVRDKGTGRTLTFSSPTTAAINVTGTGIGYAEMAVVAGTTLATNLTLNVQNTVGDPDFGALRLREIWSGSGGITKLGSGIASMTGAGKNFTGPTLITQGVLNVSQPATPTLTPSVTVQPGGQLRLSSGTLPGEPDRIYTFGGPIILSGSGRGPEIADNLDQGKLGALRYESGAGINRAILTNPVQLSGPADIHIGGLPNRLTLTAPIIGAFPLRKSGGGTLALTGPMAAHTSPIFVDNGTLEISGSLGSPITLAPTSTLRGHGATAAITGEGHVLLPATVLSAPASSASAYSFMFGKTGLPVFGNTASSINSAALLNAAPTGLLTIDIYLTSANPTLGEIFQGGLIVPASQNLTAAIAGATFRVFVPNPSGATAFEGQTWSPYPSPFQLTSTAGNLPLAAPFQASNLLQLRLGNPPLTGFAAWQATNFTSPADLADPLISGPIATPFGDDVANVLRYALGVPAGASPLPYLPISARSGQSHGLTFPFDPTRTDITVQVQSSTDLQNWPASGILFNSSTGTPPPTDAAGNLTILGPPSTGGKEFYRIAVTKP